MRTVLRTLLGMFLLVALVLGGAFWWLFLKDAPRNHLLDSARWRAVPAHVQFDQNPRRDMVRSVRRWLEREHPTQAEVRMILGTPDGLERGRDSRLIGCFASWICMDGEALVVEYLNGRASGSHFVQY